jgi:hypothetical protein
MDAHIWCFQICHTWHNHNGQALWIFVETIFFGILGHGMDEYTPSRYTLYPIET